MNIKTVYILLEHNNICYIIELLCKYCWNNKDTFDYHLEYEIISVIDDKDDMVTDNNVLNDLKIIDFKNLLAHQLLE